MARDLAMKMLRCDENLRPDAQQCLLHPWLINPAAQKIQLDPKSLQALSKSINNSKIQQRILLEAASQIPPCELQDINATFKLLDVNGDGMLSANELIVGMQRIGMSAQAARALAGVLDADADGKIEYSEFLAGLVDRCCLQFQDALWTIFCKYDTDRSGCIDQRELQRMLAEGGLEAGGLVRSERDARNLLSSMDTDGDGQISYHELCDYLMPAAEPVSLAVAVPQPQSNAKAPAYFEPSQPPDAPLPSSSGPPAYFAPSKRPASNSPRGGTEQKFSSSRTATQQNQESYRKRPAPASPKSVNRFSPASSKLSTSGAVTVTVETRKDVEYQNLRCSKQGCDGSFPGRMLICVNASFTSNQYNEYCWDGFTALCPKHAKEVGHSMKYHDVAKNLNEMWTGRSTDSDAHAKPCECVIV